MTQSDKQDIEIAIIKEKVSKIETWIDNADHNHFPTIEKRFDRIEQRLAYYSAGITIVLALIQIALKFLIK